MREKPVVVIVTDSHRQKHGCLTQIRQLETMSAMSILGAPVLFLGIPDLDLTPLLLEEKLKALNPVHVWAPARQYGHKDHDIVSQVARKLWPDRTTYYATYTKTCFIPKGDTEINPTDRERALKELALSAYKSQRVISADYFEAVENRPEYYIREKNDAGA